MINPCIKCIERESGCQSRCQHPDHIKYEQRQITKRNLIYNAKHEQAEAKQYATESIGKQLHKRG